MFGLHRPWGASDAWMTSNSCHSRWRHEDIGGLAEPERSRHLGGKTRRANKEHGTIWEQGKKWTRQTTNQKNNETMIKIPRRLVWKLRKKKHLSAVFGGEAALVFKLVGYDFTGSACLDYRFTIPTVFRDVVLFSCNILLFPGFGALAVVRGLVSPQW